MKSTQITNSSNSALTGAAAAGFVFAIIAGPIGALLASIIGAALGFWHDKKENSTKKHLLSEGQIKETIA